MQTLLDWVTCTFEMRDESAKFIVDHLALVTGLQIVGEEKRGRPGFTNGLQLRVLHNFEVVPFAVLAWGGEHQRGRAMLELSGQVCGMIGDWVAVRAMLESLPEARLTRVDVACDLHNGMYTVDDCAAWYKAGEFDLRGRKPSSSLAGDWYGEQEGRTLYIGKAKNGKGLRCYEKGKQLGDKMSNWVRFEVQFGNRDRVLPFELLTDHDTYFVAAYPALARIVLAGGTRIETTQTVADISLTVILDALHRTYGKWFHVFDTCGINVTDLVASISIRELPARVQGAAVVADVLRNTGNSTFEKWSQKCY